MAEHGSFSENGVKPVTEGFAGARESDTSRSYYHQLLVLGNGFDLECGLPSKYADFFDPRIEAIKAQDWRKTGKLEGLGYDASPTIWDFLLDPEVHPHWYSVEEAIGVLVLSAGDGKSAPEGLALKLIRGIQGVSASDAHADGEGGEVIPCSTDEDRMVAHAVEYIRHDRSDVHSRDARAWSPKELVEYLGQQLAKLEANFRGYMLSISGDNDEYAERACDLLDLMLADDVPEKMRAVSGVTILSFNYTNPFAEKLEQAKAVRMTNVHGSLDGGIIFGIDGTKCVDNALAFPFSKTFRVITAGTDFGEGTVRVGGNKLNPATRVIKFYGHSLGEADYAYFQAIFDGVNLYACDTKLIFYYRPYLGPDGKPVSEKRARNKMAAIVTRLLAEYGKTLDNENHGRNLMHKLMIEGRLEVRLL